ncbi:MAG TPA: hypothetical protein P5218_16835 [Planctomycetota bacterium]|nr:hypothetical protein [Planctomycetota bacterium]
MGLLHDTAKNTAANTAPQPTPNRTMTYGDFETDRKFCSHCQAYVAYLASPTQCFCTQCGEEVRLMSPTDWERFNHERGAQPVKTKARKGSKKRSAGAA